MGRPDGRKTLGRPRCRWKGNIKIDLQELGWRGMGRIDLALDKDRWGSCDFGNEPICSIKYGEFLD